MNSLSVVAVLFLASFYLPEALVGASASATDTIAEPTLADVWQQIKELASAALEHATLPQCSAALEEYINESEGAKLKDASAVLDRARADLAEWNAALAHPRPAEHANLTAPAFEALVRRQTLAAELRLNAAKDAVAAVHLHLGTIGAAAPRQCLAEAYVRSSQTKSISNIDSGRPVFHHDDDDDASSAVSTSSSWLRTVQATGIVHCRIFLASLVVVAKRFSAAEFTPAKAHFLTFLNHIYRHIDAWYDETITRLDALRHMTSPENIREGLAILRKSRLGGKSINPQSSVMGLLFQSPVEMFELVAEITACAAMVAALAMGAVGVVVALALTAQVFGPLLVAYHVMYAWFWRIWIKLFLYQHIILSDVPPIQAASQSGFLATWLVQAPTAIFRALSADFGASAVVIVVLMTFVLIAFCGSSAPLLVLLHDLIGPRLDIVMPPSVPSQPAADSGNGVPAQAAGSATSNKGGNTAPPAAHTSGSHKKGKRKH